MNYKRIFLVGFMCSGKSTVGKILSSRLGWSFADVDEEVQKAEAMTIQEIFEKKGEDYFRRLELEMLKALSQGENIVISTGGGLGSNPHAMELMKSKGLVAWLKVGFDTFIKRCGKDPSRPLLRKGKEELLKLFEERSKIYAQAHIVLDASLKPEEIVEGILNYLLCKKG
ncbi:MAG: shikimate kinase [Aquificaceae bacterium]